MNDQPEHATTDADAGMDRRVVVPTKPWWRRKWMIFALVVAAALAALWHFVPAGGSTDVAESDLEIREVARAQFADFLPLRATAAPKVTTMVSAKTAGQVDQLLVQDGAYVRAGDALAKLSNAEFKLDVSTREAQLAAQLGDMSGQDLGLERNHLDRASQVAQARYDLIKARRELAIRQQLHDKGFLADTGVKSFREEAEYQQNRLNQLLAGELTESRIAGVQQKQLGDARQRLEQNLLAVRSTLDALVIRAPASGRLSNFSLQLGQPVRVGDSVGQVDSEASWKLVANVDEFYLGRVRVGQVAISTDGSELLVTKILPAVSNGRFTVELGFQGRTPPLSRGQTLDLRITLGATAVAVVAPSGSWTDSGGGTTVFVVDADGRHAHRRNVKLGRRNTEQVEILSGLSPGEKIIVSGASAVRGDSINIK